MVEYGNKRDMKYAVEKLDDSEYRGRSENSYVRVRIAGSRDKSRSRSKSRSRLRLRVRLRLLLRLRQLRWGFSSCTFGEHCFSTRILYARRAKSMYRLSAKPTRAA